MTAVVVLLGFLFLKTGEKFATQETAGPAVAEFMTVLGQPLAVKFAPQVCNDPAQAVEYVTGKQPAFGIVTPGFYLAYAKALEMTPLMEVRRTGVAGERYVVVMRKEDGDGVAAVRGKVLATTLAAEERFVSGVVLEDKVAELRLKSVTDAESAAFDVVEKGDAVLLEEATWTALAKDEELGAKLKVVYRSAELPGPLFVTFGKAKLEAEKVKAVLKGLDAAVTGRIRIEKFVELDEKRLQQAEARFHGR
jgi:hypothetical protein